MVHWVKVSITILLSRSQFPPPGVTVVTSIFIYFFRDFLCVISVLHTNGMLWCIVLCASFLSLSSFFLFLLSFFLACLLACFLSILLFRAPPTVYGSSQARSQIRTETASVCHSHSNARICDLHHSPWQCRIRMEPTSSWILIGFISAAPQWELPKIFFSLGCHPISVHIDMSCL